MFEVVTRKISLRMTLREEKALRWLMLSTHMGTESFERMLQLATHKCKRNRRCSADFPAFLSETQSSQEVYFLHDQPYSLAQRVSDRLAHQVSLMLRRTWKMMDSIHVEYIESTATRGRYISTKVSKQVYHVPRYSVIHPGETKSPCRLVL
jgi:hypothetical protein